jgi:hypothetical protein
MQFSHSNYIVKLLIIALSRSGHHAVINWIASQLPGTTFHHNNCNENFRPTQTKNYGNGEPINHIWNFEDFNLEGCNEIIKESDFDQILLVMRDPFNWMASCLKKGTWHANLRSLQVKQFNDTDWYCPWFSRTMSRYKMYLQYAAQIERHENYLEKFLDINYNKWVKNINYRKELAKKIGFEFTDKGIDFIPKFGGGSSFGSETIKDLDVLNRWKYYKDDPSYWKLLDDEFIEFSRRYFNFDPMQKFNQAKNPFRQD